MLGCYGSSHSSVVRVLTAKVGGLGFDSHAFFSSVCFYPDLPPAVVNQYSYKNNHVIII